MNKLTIYRDIKRRLVDAERWAAMLGKRYAGGGGGLGKLTTVYLDTAQLLYQEYDGATNYHGAPEYLLQALSHVIEREFPRLLDAALEDMRKAATVAAAEARAEYQQLAEDAGLELTE